MATSVAELVFNHGVPFALANEYMAVRHDNNNHSAPRVGSSSLYSRNFNNIKWS